MTERNLCASCGYLMSAQDATSACAVSVDAGMRDALLSALRLRVARHFQTRRVVRSIYHVAQAIFPLILVLGKHRLRRTRTGA